MAGTLCRLTLRPSPMDHIYCFCTGSGIPQPTGLYIHFFIYYIWKVWISFVFNKLPHKYFQWCGNVFKKKEKKWVFNKLWHKYFWLPLSIENECFIHVSFHSIWYGSLENATELSTKTVLSKSCLHDTALSTLFRHWFHSSYKINKLWPY
jgi:hypothetical protein